MVPQKLQKFVTRRHISYENILNLSALALSFLLNLKLIYDEFRKTEGQCFQLLKSNAFVVYVVRNPFGGVKGNLNILSVGFGLQTRPSILLNIYLRDK